MNELEQRIAEASESAVHGGRTAMAKLESKIKELEIELSGIQEACSFDTLIPTTTGLNTYFSKI